jgi:peroxisome-assembly ATPase
MYENKARLLCTAEAAPIELFENMVTISEAQKNSPRSSRSKKKMTILTYVWTTSLGLPRIVQLAGNRSRQYFCINHSELLGTVLIVCHFGDCRLTEINSREYLEDMEEKLHQHQPLQGVDSGDVVLA